MTVPYFDDEWGRSGEDGKTYYVPADMKYKDWKKAFVDGDKTDLQEMIPDDTMKVEEPEQKHTVIVDRPIIEQDAVIEQAKIYGDDLLQHPDLIQYDNCEGAMKVTGYEEAKWSRFCGGLLGYINDYYNRFVKTDYEIELDMTIEEVTEELQSATSISDLSPQLKIIAERYESTVK